MSLADFVHAAQTLSAPHSDSASRHVADQWLTEFKRSPKAWAVAQQALQQGAGLDVALPAAQILAWKSKKQLAQLDPAQQAQLVELLAGLLASPALGEGPLLRAVCVALANLAIQCTDWARPLEMLGARLPQGALLVFLTVLPQECEDAAAAAQSGTAEQAFHLKQRVREWCMDVIGWLHNLHCSTLRGQLRGQEAADLECAVAMGGVAEATVPLVGCFTAWAKWGCLQYIEPEHAAYFTRAAGALLHGPTQAAGVDALSEVIEHATEALAPLLVETVLRLPPHVEQAVQHGEGGAELSHLFSLFCSTHQRLCVGDAPESQALRQGLLRLLALPRPASTQDEGRCEAWAEAILPAVDAAYEVVEHMLRLRKGEGEEDEEEGASPLAPRPCSPAACQEFFISVLGVLLQQLQPFASAFGMPAPGDSRLPGWSGGSHPPQGVPQTVRDEAELVLDVLGEALGGDTLMQQLQAAMEGTLARHGMRSVQSAMALDVCFYCLRCGGSVYGSYHYRPGQSSPPWFPYMLRLYSLAAEVAPVSGGAEAPAPVTILDFDLLSSVTALAPALVPLLGAGESTGGGAFTGFTDLMLARALHATSAPLRSPDVSHGSTTDAVDAAADAVRALCSFGASASMQTSEATVVAIEQLLQQLQQPGRVHAYQAAHQQLVAALVHAAESAPPGAASLLQRTAAAMQTYVFAPFAASLQQLLQDQEATEGRGGGAGPWATGVAATGPAGSPGRPRQTALATAAWRLQWALKQVQALLNALELYQVYDGNGQVQQAGGGSVAAAPAGLQRAAVEAFLGCWHCLVAVCRRPLPAEVYQELSLCLVSCISLDPVACEPALGSLADLAAAPFFVPGGAQLGQALCRVVEIYGCQPRYQQPLLDMLSTLLDAPQAQAMAGLGGGDAQPEGAQALLSLAGCTLWQAATWQRQPGHQGPPPTLGRVLPAALRLAVANAACNHRDVSQRAVAVLSSLAALAQEWGSDLGAEARTFMRQQGSGVVQGMMMALVSLNSSAHLPKVVSLMGDVALLAAACAMPQDCAVGVAVDAAALYAAASQLLSTWLAEAQAGLVAGGLLPQDAAAALLGQLAWQGVLQQATVQSMQRLQEQGGAGVGGLGSPGGMEVRRAMQRSLRQMADAIKQAGLCS